MQPPQLTTWSNSRLDVYEKCPKHAYYKFILKEPEPERPLPAGKTEHANERGDRIHKALEDYVNTLGTSEFPEEAVRYRAHLDRAVALKQLDPTVISAEGEWGFTRAWQSCDFHAHDVCGRMKIDLFLRMSTSTALIVDYKTGKYFGNEISHLKQANVYHVGAFMRYPELTEITTEFWYIDHPHISHHAFRRADCAMHLSTLGRRIDAMLNERQFLATPSVSACRWCPYKAICDEVKLK